MIIDVSAIPDERSVPLPAGDRTKAGDAGEAGSGRVGRTIEDLARQARDLAGRPSPYTRGAAAELWHQAGEDPVVVQAAVAELVELLARHDRHSAGAADSEWLQLITAKRLLNDALGLADEPVGRLARRAMI